MRRQLAAQNEQKQHAEAQREYFRSRISVFLQPIPEEILARTQRIAESANLSAGSQVLDVGTGTGALIVHILDLGVKQENITGVDLSEDMLTEARARFPHVKFVKADILDAETVIGKAKQFDAVFFNACFGNIYDQKMALERTHALLSRGGSIIISHPLGKRFVKALHESDPSIVPYLLPERDQLLTWARALKMQLVEFIDQADFYLARLQ